MGPLGQIAGGKSTKPATNKPKKEKDLTSPTTGSGVLGVREWVGKKQNDWGYQCERLE